MKTYNKVVAAVLAVGFTFGLGGLARVTAATTVQLGAADSMAILAGSTITNTGSSVINGNLGLYPGTSVTGFPPGTVNGTQYIADTVAAQAKTDLTTAFNNAAGQTPASTVPTELGGTTKTAGIYVAADGTFGITGTLTLDAQGDPSAVFIFKTASTLITGGGSAVVLTNGAQSCNVFWEVGSSATLGTNSTFKGTLLVFTSATLTTGANVEGRVLARNGAVTLDTNNITKLPCAVAPVPTPTSTPTPAPTSTPPVVIVVASSTTPVVIVATSSTPVVTAPLIILSPLVLSATTEVAATPVLPNTGMAPYEKSSPWNVVALISIVGLVSISLVAIRRKRII